MRGSLAPFFNELEELKSFFHDCEEKCSGSIQSQISSNLSIYEDEDKIYVEAAVPGLKPEELQLTFEKGILSIKGESKEEKKNVQFHAKASSSFSYSIQIPDRVDHGSTPEAICKDGIATIAFQKSKTAKVHRIEVKKQ